MTILLIAHALQTPALDNVRDALAAVVELYEDLGKTLPMKGE